MEKAIFKLLSKDVPSEPQKDIKTKNMNITAIKVTPDTLLPTQTKLSSPNLVLPDAGLFPLLNRTSKEDIPNDEDIYNMKMINWVTHPEIPDILYLESPLLTIEFESLNASRKDKIANEIQNNITFTIQNKDQNRTNKGVIRVCSYYSFITNKWETDGCTLINETKDNYTCTCSHLTDFAINTKDIERVYEKSNVRFVFQEPVLTGFNVLRYPSFYVLLLINIIGMNLIIWGRNTEELYEINKFIINKNKMTNFEKYSFLYCKIKDKGCSREMS